MQSKQLQNDAVMSKHSHVSNHQPEQQQSMPRDSKMLSHVGTEMNSNVAVMGDVQSKMSNISRHSGLHPSQMGAQADQIAPPVPGSKRSVIAEVPQEQNAVMSKAMNNGLCSKRTHVSVTAEVVVEQKQE